MPVFFSNLNELEQCAFILGCAVDEASDSPRARCASGREDAANVQLVKELYKIRSARLSESIGLGEADVIDMTSGPNAVAAASAGDKRDNSNVRLSHERVEAHGSSAKLRN
jgi:hypothetical protein